MPVLGITGGIASGKSTLSQILGRSLSAEVFDADAAVHAQFNDGPIKQRLRDEFGAAIFSEAGEIDRAALRDAVFADDAKRRALEGVLHPGVRAQWSERAGEYRGSGRWLLVEIPLLFETAAEKCLDAIVVVACSMETQLARITEGRGIESGLARKIVLSQMPSAEKTFRADHVLWNDGSSASLERQAARCATVLQTRHG